MPTIIYLVRHGQTEDSVEGVYSGARDVSLTEAGHAMAAALARWGASLKLAAVYASPLRRAQQTAGPLARELGLPVQTEEGLRELHYGAWEGLTPEDCRQRDPQAYAAWSADPAALSPPGGESASAVAERAMRALKRIADAHATAAGAVPAEVLAVAHKSSLRAVLCALLGIDLRAFKQRLAQPLGAINVISHPCAGERDQVRLLRLGDISYLPPPLRQQAGG